jgi:hypothetical protein
MNRAPPSSPKKNIHEGEWKKRGKRAKKKRGAGSQPSPANAGARARARAAAHNSARTEGTNERADDSTTRRPPSGINYTHHQNDMDDEGEEGGGRGGGRRRRKRFNVPNGPQGRPVRVGPKKKKKLHLFSLPGIVVGAWIRVERDRALRGQTRDIFYFFWVCLQRSSRSSFNIFFLIFFLFFYLLFSIFFLASPRPNRKEVKRKEGKKERKKRKKGNEDRARRCLDRSTVDRVARPGAYIRVYET